MPFDLLCKNKELQAALHDDFATQITEEEYRDKLEDVLEEARENSGWGYFKIPLLVEMVRAQVPADALAKVQRRFRLLDRGPAFQRKHPYGRK